MVAFRSVRHWRLSHGWSQQELARRSGVQQSTISLIESGKKSDLTVKTVEKIARAFGVGPEELFITPPREALTLTRHEREAIAHAVVEGTPAPDGVSPRLIRDMAGLVTQKLRAYHVPGAAMNRGRRWRVHNRWLDVRETYGEALVLDLLHRIDTELLRHG